MPTSGPLPLSTLLVLQFFNGLGWTVLVGNLLIIYGYLMSNKRILWAVLLCFALSGILGGAIENIFRAMEEYDPNHNWPMMLGIGEVFLIINESCVVLYSLLKLEVAIPSERVKMALRGFLLLCFVGYSAGRVWDGVIRVNDRTTSDSNTKKVQGIAFIFWGLADMAIFGLLGWVTIYHVRKSGDQVASVVRTIMTSSLPRLFIIAFTTILLIIIGVIEEPNNVDLQNFYTLVISIKCSYPLILLFDMMHTKNQLIKKTSRFHSDNSSNSSQSGDIAKDSNEMSMDRYERYNKPDSSDPLV